jgi:hypothetical protein
MSEDCQPWNWLVRYDIRLFNEADSNAVAQFDKYKAR